MHHEDYRHAVERAGVIELPDTAKSEPSVPRTQEVADFLAATRRAGEYPPTPVPPRPSAPAVRPSHPDRGRARSAGSLQPASSSPTSVPELPRCTPSASTGGASWPSARAACRR